MRLVGAAAAGANAAELRKLAEPILALQRSDGGWAQRQAFPSDAYATGMTVWALNEAGVMRADSNGAAKAVKFLLGTQSPDGSWHVASRATKFQQYFESGFRMSTISGSPPWPPAGPPLPWLCRSAAIALILIWKDAERPSRYRCTQSPADRYRA